MAGAGADSMLGVASHAAGGDCTFLAAEIAGIGAALCLRWPAAQSGALSMPGGVSVKMICITCFSEHARLPPKDSCLGVARQSWLKSVLEKHSCPESMHSPCCLSDVSVGHRAV